MFVVQNGFESIKGITGKQKYMANDTYRESAFLVKTQHADGMLYYHTLTGELLLLDKDDWKYDEDLKKDLVAGWFLVPEDFDDAKHCDQVRSVAKLMNRDEDYINRFIIFTTTDCNARCFYCFEMGQKRFSMTEETAADVADYILRVSKGKKISIRWFGGEPLFNHKVIDIISGRLREAGADYSSIMVTNAYLFDDEMIQKAVDLWKLKSVLVTLDGTEEVYNKTKAYIYEGGSAFRRVLGNLKKLTEAGINVTVNLSMDRRNTEDLMELATDLSKRFAGKGNFFARAIPLKEYVGKINSFENDQQALEKLERINKSLESFGIREKQYLPNRIKMNSCMADDPHSVTILPDGRTGRCEHHGDSEETGNIYGLIDKGAIESWKELRPSEVRCRTCMHYPTCLRLKKCNAYEEVCDHLTRTRMTIYLKEKMINTYERWCSQKK